VVGLGAAGAAFSGHAKRGADFAATDSARKRRDNSRGGVGTSEVFDVGSGARARRPDRVVQALIAASSIVDTAPSYGEAERWSAIFCNHGLRPRAFIATSLRNIARREESEARTAETPSHGQGGFGCNFTMCAIPTRTWRRRCPQGRGICRYTGITTTFERSYGAAEAIIKRARPDFLEVDYASTIAKRKSPVAGGVGRSTAVLVALPFGADGCSGSRWARSCRMGSRIRLRQLGTIFPEIHSGTSAQPR